MSFTVTITINQSGAPVVNADGTATVATTPVVVPGCVVHPATSVETVQGQDNVITGLTLLAPFGTVIKSTDTVTFAGVTYAVVGDAFQWQSSFTGTPGRVQVALTRAH